MVSCFVLVLALVLGSASAVQAQPPGGGGPGGGGFGGGRGMGGFGNNPLFLLANEKVREELEIVDDQMAELEGLQEDIRNEMREMFGGMRDSTDEERREMMEEAQERMKEYQAKVDEILLPQQQTRLKQLMVQSQSRGRLGGGLLSDSMKEELNITDEQAEKVTEAAEEAQKEMDAEIQKLRRAAEEKILSVLSSEQQQKYRDMVGEAFDFGQFGFGGGRGNGGGRGGERGGGGERNRSDF